MYIYILLANDGNVSYSFRKRLKVAGETEMNANVHVCVHTFSCMHTRTHTYTHEESCQHE